MQQHTSIQLKIKNKVTSSTRTAEVDSNHQGPAILDTSTMSALMPYNEETLLDIIFILLIA
jgi:hypothetical protein